VSAFLVRRILGALVALLAASMLIFAATDPLTFRGTLYVVSQADGSTLYSLKMGGLFGEPTYADRAGLHHLPGGPAIVA